MSVHRGRGSVEPSSGEAGLIVQLVEPHCSACGVKHLVGETVTGKLTWRELLTPKNVGNTENDCLCIVVATR